MTTMTVETTAPARRAPIMSRALALRFGSILGSATSFYLVVSVVPMYGGGDQAAGLSTGALMLTTVLGELATPRLIARYGLRPILAVGLVLLGAPLLALPLSASVGWIVAVCLVRGLGFAFTVVAGGALTAALIPADRRGEGLAVVGLVSGIPSMAAMPLGVWLSGRIGYTPVLVIGGLAALAALVTLPGLPGTTAVADKSEDPRGMVAGLRSTSLRRPALYFSATTMAGGVLVTFLPLAITGKAAGTVALALLAQPAASTAARWLSGRYGDRKGMRGLLVPSLVAAAAGMALLSLTTIPAAAVIGALIFGAGFGVVQNISLTMMYGSVSAAEYGTVAAVWNLAYDAGWGLGAVGFGFLVPLTGDPVAFTLTAALMLAALSPALRLRR